MNICRNTGQGNKPRYDKTLDMEINQDKEAHYCTQYIIKTLSEKNNYIVKCKTIHLYSSLSDVNAKPNGL